MNKEQYNNIINHTLLTNSIVNSDSNLVAVKNILNKMGVPLPNGDLQDVFNTLQTNSYMGWRMCTLQDAQTFANQGIATIGVGK